ncbi:UNVERIFIED_CONTAM: hypothetical protein GTU68_005136, partial [Idotea baltica]|nr:hypothetical protein [Idotea baltica]
MKAHGAVLSATSRYFERVLSDVTSDQHPIIVLKGANFVELSCLLDYIYQGVTQVDQHLMESVLDVADMLEIKGLSKMKNNLSIKKLIAPSPTSSVVSRNSPLCSSPSKSPPPPPSHASQSHSLSCPSSPNDTYAAPSAMFKMDADDQSELNELNQKGKHTTFPDSRPSISSRLMDNHEYEANPSKQSSCSNSEYLDQTLGIDLSLSRATNEDDERASVKNFNLYEDSHLRKKKIMKKFEEVNPSFPDLEWDKVGEKVRNS